LSLIEAAPCVHPAKARRIASVASAAEVKKDKAHIPAVKATTMSDAQMDKVTAGASNATTFDDFGNILKIHHSSPESQLNGAINNMNHFK
jgi:hypothetical protein